MFSISGTFGTKPAHLIYFCRIVSKPAHYQDTLASEEKALTRVVVVSSSSSVVVVSSSSSSSSSRRRSK